MDERRKAGTEPEEQSRQLWLFVLLLFWGVGLSEQGEQRDGYAAPCPVLLIASPASLFVAQKRRTHLILRLLFSNDDHVQTVCEM
ncbi:hypothetical protein AOLI_G00027520 [Acnodon oligacanthus]